MSEPNRYSDLEVWKALHFGGSTSGWVFYVDYAKLKEENASLKADVNELAAALKLASEVGIKIADEVTRLKAEVERLEHQVNYWRIEAEVYNTRWLRCLKDYEELRASSFVTAVPVEQYERLLKAGDAMDGVIRLAWLSRIQNNKEQRTVWLRKVHQCMIDWKVAKGHEPTNNGEDCDL